MAESKDQTAARSEQARHQWRRRPLLSILIRVAVVAAPAAAGIAATLLLSRAMPRPGDAPHAVAWLALVTAAMLVAVVAVERIARRLLPLAALLNLSLLFPDDAPKRFAVARRAGRPRDLQRRLQEARERGETGGEVAFMQTVLELVAALSVHDRRTRGHSERVRVLTDLIADEMKLPQGARARLRWASLLHDIGKLMVDADVLRKPAALDRNEWARVHRHPEAGAQLIAPLREWLGEWACAVEHHHERWDGTGYPRGLRGDEISLAGRIVAVADAYEVMTATRSYRRPVGVVAAREELVRCSGEQFDPAVVRAFLNISVGRLWRVVGLGTSVADLPLVAWVNGLGVGWGTAILSGSAALGLAAPGILFGPHPSPSPPGGSSLTPSGARLDPGGATAPAPPLVASAKSRSGPGGVVMTFGSAYAPTTASTQPSQCNREHDGCSRWPHSQPPNQDPPPILAPVQSLVSVTTIAPPLLGQGGFPLFAGVLTTGSDTSTAPAGVMTTVSVSF